MTTAAVQFTLAFYPVKRFLYSIEGDDIVAKKAKPNKTQAVVEYLKAHPQAKPVEIADALTKKGIAITARYATNIKSRINNGHRKKTRARTTESVAAPTTKQPAKPSETITLEQIRKVAQAIKSVGGFVKLHELLEVIQDVGGMDRFRDLLEAMSATGTDDIPF